MNQAIQFAVYFTTMPRTFGTNIAMAQLAAHRVQVLDP
jgi:hypothetical protein